MLLSEPVLSVYLPGVRPNIGLLAFRTQHLIMKNHWFLCFHFVLTDIVPLHTILVEQCEPLRLSSLQNQRHHSYQDMVYALQEHDYETHGEGDSQMAFIVVKQEVRVSYCRKTYFPLYFFSKI